MRLDNIDAIAPSNITIDGASIEQSDGTSWMGMYCLNIEDAKMGRWGDGVMGRWGDGEMG
ncbi:hypothetical protein [Microseira sp. BLCC-F43]|uniref:hypothetical protein n=1 Tax=Microseira sp. BLCC-F43 TaxID=3153602 RepID=UPI0035B6E8EB